MCKACAMLWPMQILLPVSTIISCVISQGLSVIIITSSSVLYHILQANSSAFRIFASQSRRRRVYHPQLVAVYHQTEGLDIIKPQVDARWRVMRYSPKGADDMHHASRSDDMPSLRLG